MARIKPSKESRKEAEVLKNLETTPPLQFKPENLSSQQSSSIIKDIVGICGPNGCDFETMDLSGDLTFCLEYYSDSDE